MSTEVVTTSTRPDLADEAGIAFRERWPEYVFHDPVPPTCMERVNEYFPAFDVLLLLEGAVAAGGWGVPLAWDGTTQGLPSGYDAALLSAVEGHEAGVRPTTLCFMAAAVHPAHDRLGLATAALEALADRASQAGLEHVVAPIRPTWKHRYPTTPMTEYATWVRDDGLSVDPWIRTHQRMGARILGPAPGSMVVPGTVAEWEGWADMVFPVSGSYVVPEALDLLVVDRERDVATYREDNLWVQHR